MILYKSNYFRVVINMSQVPIKLSPSPRENVGEGMRVEQLLN